MRAITLPASIIWRTASGASSGGSAIPFGSAVAWTIPSPAVEGRESSTSRDGDAAPFGFGAFVGGACSTGASGAAAAAPSAPATGSTTLALCSEGSGGSSVFAPSASSAADRSGTAGRGCSPHAESAHARTTPISAGRRISPSMAAPERRLGGSARVRQTDTGSGEQDEEEQREEAAHLLGDRRAPGMA